MRSNLIKSTLLVFSFFVFSCSPKGFVFDGKKTQKVTVTDLGKMYSTYNVSAKEKTELTNQLTNQELVDEIITYCNEKKWPDAVNTLEKRLKVRSQMMKYSFYRVATIGGTKTIISIPKDQNKKMPQGFVPDGPMYIIVESSVINKEK